MLNGTANTNNSCAPLTHRDYIAACPLPSDPDRSQPWVQISKRYAGRVETLCGQVVQLNASREEWFKVETSIETVWVEGRNVRLCSGDGRCLCAAQAALNAQPPQPSKDPSVAVSRLYLQAETGSTDTRPRQFHQDNCNILGELA